MVWNVEGKATNVEDVLYLSISDQLYLIISKPTSDQFQGFFNNSYSTSSFFAYM